MSPSDGLLEVDPSALALCLDFDGTLTEMFQVADEATAFPGIPEVVAALTARLPAVAIISGRPVEYLLRRLGGIEDLRYLGLYGDAEAVGGVPVLRAEVARYADAVGRAKTALLADPVIQQSGAAVESKPLSVAVHLRPIAPDERDRWSAPILDVASRTAAAEGLNVEPGKLVWELRPPTAGDKGSAVRRVVAESGATDLVVVGDDLGDLPAFDAAEALRGAGIRSTRVAVESAETPPALLAKADLLVKGPAGVLALLETIVNAS